MTRRSPRKDAAISAFADRCYSPVRSAAERTRAFNADLERIFEIVTEDMDCDEAELLRLSDLARNTYTKACDTGEPYQPVQIDEPTSADYRPEIIADLVKDTVRTRAAESMAEGWQGTICVVAFCALLGFIAWCCR